MKILITGIGCIGKSSLREKLALDLPDNVISIDMDYNREIPSDGDKVVIVESVHGLEENLYMFDKILYLLPPRWHPFLWLRRAWYSTGIVDLSAPKGKRKRFAITNIPIILKILMRNIFMSKKWVKTDINQIQKELRSKTRITSSSNEEYKMIKSWVVNYMNFTDLCKTNDA